MSASRFLHTLRGATTMQNALNLNRTPFAAPRRENSALIQVAAIRRREVFSSALIASMTGIGPAIQIENFAHPVKPLAESNHCCRILKPNNGVQETLC
jgi:hypothetical protein